MPAVPRKIDDLVQPTDHRHVYFVRSDSQAGKGYRVDLVANNGAGFCPCTDFSCHRQPAIDAGGEPWTRETVCKHLERAGRYFLIAMLEALSREENEFKKAHPA